MLWYMDRGYTKQICRLMKQDRSVLKLVNAWGRISEYHYTTSLCLHYVDYINLHLCCPRILFTYVRQAALTWCFDGSGLSLFRAEWRRLDACEFQRTLKHSFQNMVWWYNTHMYLYTVYGVYSKWYTYHISIHLIFVLWVFPEWLIPYTWD